MSDQRRTFQGGPVFVTGFATLTIFFAGLGLYYLANPSGAIRALSAANQRLGGVPITAVDVVAWRYTAAVGMITLGVMCFMVLRDLRRNSSMLVPAVFFKACDIVLLVRYYLLHTRVPACLEFAAMDAVLIAAMIGLAMPARQRLVASDDEPLDRASPRAGDRVMSGWFRFERRWRDELCRAALPVVEGCDLPAVGRGRRRSGWDRFDRLAPLAMRRAWRLTVWLVTLRPLVRRGRPHRFGRLSPAEQDARLAAMGEHRSRAVAQLATLLRLVVCVTYLGDEAVRSRTTDWILS